MERSGGTAGGGRAGWRLRTYLAALVALFVAAAVVASVYVHAQSDRDARRAAIEDAAYAATASAKPLGDGIATLREALRGVAPSGAAILADPGHCALSYAKVGAYPTGHIDILRSDGSVACSSRAAGARATYGAAGWLPRANAAPLLEAPVTDVATGRPAVLITEPFRGGIAAAFLDLDPVGADLAAAFGGPRGLEFLVTTADGQTVLARSVDPARWIGTPLAATGFARAGAQVDRSDLDGTRRLYASATVPPGGWRVWAGADRRGALAAANHLYRQGAGLIAATLAIVLLAAVLVQRRVTGPIRALSDAVRAGPPAEGGPIVATRGPREVAELADDVNALMAEVARELADRHRAEDAAHVSERAYRMLFEHNPQPMWVYDTETLAFLEVNDAAVAHYGYSRDEFLSMTISHIRPQGDVPAWIAAVRAASGPVRSAGWYHLKRDGSLIEVEITAFPVEFGNRRGRVVVAEDVTERERAERQRNQSQRLESLGQLAGGVAHDFNNLLAVIMNYAAFVKEQTASAAVEDAGRWAPVDRDVEQIGRAAERGAELTRQLLAFARRDVARPAVLDLNGVLDGVEDLLRRTIGEHITLAVIHDPELWPVLADSGQVEQVLVNLAVNARDAMPDGGSLTIETANVDVDEHYAASRPALRPGRYVRLRVNDTGTGIDPETLQHVFEPFFTTKSQGAGTGLGLATVYGIVTQAGGDAQIYSEAGLGTTFTALLPAAGQRVAVAVPEPAPGGHVTRGETVLLVEDEDAIRDVTARILDRNGFRVIAAGSGREAVEQARLDGRRIDLVITDVVMPEMLGKEVADQVLAVQPGARVLYMSGYAHPVLAARGTLAPGVILVEKPFSEAVLLGRIRDALAVEPEGGAGR